MLCSKGRPGLLGPLDRGMLDPQLSCCSHNAAWLPNSTRMYSVSEHMDSSWCPRMCGLGSK